MSCLSVGPSVLFVCSSVRLFVSGWWEEGFGGHISYTPVRPSVRLWTLGIG